MSKVAIVCFNYVREKLHKQPWHTVKGLAIGLSGLDYDVTLITDRASDATDREYDLLSVGSLYEKGRPSASLLSALEEIEAEYTYVVIGPHELLKPFRFRLPGKVILVLAAPRLFLREISRLFHISMLPELKLSTLTVINSLLPGIALKVGYWLSRAQGVVYFSPSAQLRYYAAGLPIGHYFPVITSPKRVLPAFEEHAGPFHIAYYGPPLRLRGYDLCLRAFEQLRASGRVAKLSMLFRSAESKEMDTARDMIERSPWSQDIEAEYGSLSPDDLRARLQKIDVAALPFRSTVSDVPLVVLEAGQSGRKVVSLSTPGVGEFVEAFGGDVCPVSDFDTAFLDAHDRRGKPNDGKEYGSSRSWADSARRMLDDDALGGHVSGVYFVGSDGVGKTTLCKEYIKWCKAKALPVRYVWSRFRNYLSKPLLGITRLTGHNRKETVDGVKIGYHIFSNNAALSYAFLLFQWVDQALDIFFRYRIFGRGMITVGDRCVLDTLVDLAVDTKRESFILGAYARSLLSMMPKGSRYLWVTRGEDKVLACRADVAVDANRDERNRLYNRLCTKLGLQKISNNTNIEEALGMTTSLLEVAINEDD